LIVQAGFDRGWEDANAALKAGMNVDLEDPRKWSKMRTKDCHVSEDDWEWVHGHGKGQQEAAAAGRNT
jgi:uncharacterized lipoprotein